jgi:hypothetical protein
MIISKNLSVKEAHSQLLQISSRLANEPGITFAEAQTDRL